MCCSKKQSCTFGYILFLRWHNSLLASSFNWIFLSDNKLYILGLVSSWSQNIKNVVFEISQYQITLQQKIFRLKNNVIHAPRTIS